MPDHKDVRIEKRQGFLDMKTMRGVYDPDGVLGSATSPFILAEDEHLVITQEFLEPEQAVQALANVIAARDAEIVDLKEQVASWKQAADQNAKQRDEARKDVRTAWRGARNLRRRYIDLETSMHGLKAGIEALNQDEDDPDEDDPDDDFPF